MSAVGANVGVGICKQWIEGRAAVAHGQHLFSVMVRTRPHQNGRQIDVFLKPDRHTQSLNPVQHLTGQFEGTKTRGLLGQGV